MTDLLKCTQKIKIVNIQMSTSNDWMGRGEVYIKMRLEWILLASIIVDDCSGKFNKLKQQFRSKHLTLNVT
jgi:hypothetical protein